MLAVVFVLAATLTLLPAVLAKLGPRVDKLALPWVHSGEHRSPRFARLGRAAVAPAGRLRRRRRSWSLVALAVPVLGLDTGMPSIKVVPARRRLARRLRAGPGGLRRRARRARCRSSRPQADAAAVAERRRGATRASRAVMPPQPGARRPGARPGHAARTTRPTRPSARPIDRLRAALPAGALVGGAVAENHDLEAALVAQDAAGDRRRARARLPAAAGRAAGAADRGRRRAHEPARDRRGVRRREADLPGRPPRPACSASSRRASSTPGGRCSSSR